MNRVVVSLVSITLLLFGSGETWTRLSPTGSAPAGRCGPASVYDSTADRFIVWGGAGASGCYDNLYALDSSAAGNGVWRLLSPSGTPPAGRYYAAYVYDAPRHRMIIFGGFNRSLYFDDVHFLDSINTAAPRWIQPTVSGTPPSARYACGMAYDPIKQRMIVFGGGSTTGGDNLVFVLENLNSTPTWRQLSPSGTPPGGKHGPTCIYDFRNDRFLVFSGYPHSNDVWALDSLQAGDGVWSQWSPGGTPPPARNGAISIFDVWNDRMMPFGGWNGSQYFNDLYGLDGISGTSPSWSQLSPSGTIPAGRWVPSSALDGLRRRAFVFGGIGGGSYFNDVYTLTWQVDVAEQRNANLHRLITSVAPNPFRTTTTIRLGVNSQDQLSIKIYDVQGRAVRTIVTARNQGHVAVTWNGRDDDGRELPSGAYFMVIGSGHDRVVERVIKIQ